MGLRAARGRHPRCADAITGSGVGAGTDRPRPAARSGGHGGPGGVRSRGPAGLLAGRRAGGGRRALGGRLLGRRPAGDDRARPGVAVHPAQRGGAGGAVRRGAAGAALERRRVAARAAPGHLPGADPRHPGPALRDAAVLLVLQARRHRRLHPAHRDRRPQDRRRRHLPQLAGLLRRQRPAHRPGRQPGRPADRQLVATGVQPDQPGGAALPVPRPDPQRPAGLAGDLDLLHHHLGRPGLLRAPGDGVRALPGLHRSAGPSQGDPAR